MLPVYCLLIYVGGDGGVKAIIPVLSICSMILNYIKLHAFIFKVLPVYCLVVVVERRVII